MYFGNIAPLFVIETLNVLHSCQYFIEFSKNDINDAESGLQIKRIAVNIMNKHSCSTKGGPSASASA
jgi:hypothetical protein